MRETFLQYLRHPARQAAAAVGLPSGRQLARLIAHDLRVVQRFDDHAWVIGRLVAASEFDTLLHVAASGLLHGASLRLYRWAIDAGLDRQVATRAMRDAVIR